jgi:hypothetical protein
MGHLAVVERAKETGTWAALDAVENLDKIPKRPRDKDRIGRPDEQGHAVDCEQRDHGTTNDPRYPNSAGQGRQ